MRSAIRILLILAAIVIQNHLTRMLVQRRDFLIFIRPLVERLGIFLLLGMREIMVMGILSLEIRVVRIIILRKIFLDNRLSRKKRLKNQECSRLHFKINYIIFFRVRKHRFIHFKDTVKRKDLRNESKGGKGVFGILD